ncbi:uncharacterized protein LOC128255991 isoform X2 [Drosophila gunungcola]|uniref:uncharacterized protein LOC128255991 isoform X2 n=1 Tax=Drosophila gunungcola TaxID=103775 RepID=UPI0022E24A67|nr:uncharacterized protein LOC128255991 isoform X2 [Drosophila gunungcola]
MLRWLQIGILLPLFSLGRGNFSSGSFNLTLYRQMPPLHQLDDYDLCLDRPSGSYCLAYVEILPNASSTLWHLIHEVSQDSKHRFRHDRVFRGVCLEGCKKRLIDLSESREHEEGTFLDQELIAYYAKVHRRASDADERLLYEELVNSCLNLKFGEEFSLQTRSLIEYCDTADDHLEHDGLDLIFYALLICILLLTLCSSIYDFRLSQINPQQTENFYRKAPSSRSKCKHPNLTRPLYITLSILALAVPAILTYVLELDAVYHLRPETYRYLYFRHSDTFYQMYPPFYTNLGGYLLGFLCGHLYLKKRPQGLVFRGNLKFELAMWLLVLATLGLLFSGYIFIRQDFAKPSLWLALYAGVHKNLWLLICAGFVFLMCCKVGGMAYDFCTLPLFRPLARISFQSFLWHVVILRIVAGCFRQPVYVSSFYLMCNVLSVFIITQVVAAFVAIVLELPLGEVLRCLMKPETGREEPNPVIQTSRAQSAV